MEEELLAGCVAGHERVTTWDYVANDHTGSAATIASWNGKASSDGIKKASEKLRESHSDGIRAKSTPGSLCRSAGSPSNSRNSRSSSGSIVVGVDEAGMTPTTS